MTHGMTSRAPYTGDPALANRTVSQTYQLGRRTLTQNPPTWIKISGERGVFRFMEHTVTQPADRRRKPREWVYVIGGTAGVKMNRFFDPARITRVVPAPGKSVRG